MIDEVRPAIRRVVLVQAMNSAITDHWYPWLADRLRGGGLEVLAPAMPDPSDPDAAAWQATLEDEVATVDDATLVVAHSVGNAAALRWLSSLPEGWSLGGLIDVAGFAEPQPGNPATPPFMDGLELDRVRHATGWRHAFISADDPEIPRPLSDRLALWLGSTVHVVEGAGHFRAADGYTAFPALAELIESVADDA